MNLRRHRRARTLALFAFLLAAIVWAFSIFFVTTWYSHPWTLPDIDPGTNAPFRAQLKIEVNRGALIALFPGRFGGDRSRCALTSAISVRWWTHFGFLTTTPFRPEFYGPASPTTRFRILDIPLWIPIALTLPPLLLTHARVRRPLARLRRGLCHRCAYDLASTPPDSPCPECGTARLTLPPRQGRPAHRARPPRPVAALGNGERDGERGENTP